jgi:hypothetical protein
VPVAPAAVDVLTALVGVLPRWGPWYLFGAQAVVAYGVPRLSADVDVTLRLTPDSPERFVEDMRVAGFELRVDDPEFVRRTRVLPFVHVASGMPLDVVLAGSGLEDEFLTRARLLDIGGLRVPTIDPEDLIIAKVLAGRPKDLGDARGLWRARGHEMDIARIASVLRLLEEALSQSDLTPAFDAIRRRDQAGPRH